MPGEITSIDVQTLRHRIDEVPSSILPHIRMGFKLLSQGDISKRDALITSLLDAFEANQNFDSRAAAATLGVPENAIGDVLAAISLSVGAVLDLDVDSESYIDSGKGKLFDAEYSSTATDLITRILNRKPKLKDAADRGSLANAVLPSFGSLSYQIDVRLRFDDNNLIIKSVPVAVLSIGTDCDETLYFQATVDDVTKMIDRLTTALSRLTAANGITLERQS